VIVKDVKNIFLIGSEEFAVIQCSGKLSFSFQKVVRLHISNIVFLTCGLEVRGDFKGDIAGLTGQLYLNEEKGYPLPTLARKISCRRFD